MTIRQLLSLGTALIAVGQPAFAQTAVPAETNAAKAAAPAAPALSGEANAAAAATRVAPEPDPQSEAQAAALAASPDGALRTAASDVFKVIPRAAELPHGATMTRAKIDLGSMLFFDPRMSKSGVFSCQSCHNIGMGGVDGLETSIGHGRQQGPRNAPTMLNAVFDVAQFWDGRAPDLAAQAQGPVQAGVEMNNTPST